MTDHYLGKAICDMEAIVFNTDQSKLNQSKRDIINFINARIAKPSDDFNLGQFLIHSFQVKQTEKTPYHNDTDERLLDLMNVQQRRDNGVVIVYELGYKIIGTFTLFYPSSNLNNSWLPNSTLLRCVAIDPSFQGLDLATHLLDDADRISYQMGARHCCLHVFKIATSVARLYEKNGYLRDSAGDHISSGAEVLGYAKKIASDGKGSSRVILL